MRQALIAQWFDSPEYMARLRNKVTILKKMEEDPYFRAERIQNVYAVDPVAFIEDFCLIKLTEFSGKPTPFFLFPYQKRIIQKFQETEMDLGEHEVLIDKPRGMGVTWLLVSYLLWRFLFTPNYAGFVLSRSESEVDDGTNTPDGSIFGKLRWQMARLPRFMIPEGFQAKKARGTSTDMTLKLINPAIGSSIIGSSTNANAGRSRRYSTIFIDECFAIERFAEVYRALQSVSKNKFFISTAKAGFQNKKFADMCEQNGDRVSLTWQDHPFKDQQWYEDQLAKAEFDPEVMKEVDVGYAINERAQYYPEIKHSRVLPLQYDPNYPLYCFLDFGGRQDLTVIEYAQFIGGRLRLLSAYRNTNKPTEWYAPFMNPEVHYNPDAYNPKQIQFLSKVRTWKKPAAYFGEQDHLTPKRPDNKSDQSVLGPLGIRIHVNTYAIQHPPRRAAVVSFLPRTDFNQEDEGAMWVYDAIMQSRYTNPLRTTSENLKPVHDPEIADARAAFENGCVNMGRVIKAQRGDVNSEADRSFYRGIINKLRV